MLKIVISSLLSISLPTVSIAFEGSENNTIVICNPSLEKS